MPTVDDEIRVHDFLGVGFGPSNLALAVAFSESKRQVDGLFFESQPAFGWHRGMLMSDTTMQVSFLKDLVTLRNPTSRYSFLCYLRDRGRLADFINHKNLFPSRVEFHDYLEWVAGQFAHAVRYGSEVVSVRPGGDHLDVIVRHGRELETHRARNLVLATGLRPHLPTGVTPSERVWHNYDLLHRLAALPADRPHRFVVVGAGQSAAETVEYLHRTFPSAQIHAVYARYGYSPADDSPFVNGIFDPEAVDHFYAADHDVKRMLVDYHRGTNYSAVDTELIDELYRRIYQEKVSGRRRLHMRGASKIVDLRSNADGVRALVEFLPTGELRGIEADYVIHATGYRPSDPTELLGEIAEHCHRDERGELAVTRDYRVLTDDELTAGIYLQGPTEHSHGISSTLLSVTAVRAGEIAESIADRAAQPFADRGVTVR